MFGWLCGRYPGLIGNLWGPGRSVTVWPFAPYALDNGAYVAYAHQVEWDSAQWLKLLASVQRAPHPPLWAVVPDVVGNRERTLESWQRYYPIVRDAGLTPAFAVQDGMEAADIPSEAEVIFVGGTTQWKWSTMEQWCQQFPRGFAGDTANCRDLLISVNLPLAGESTQNSKPFLVQECGKTLLIDWNGKWASLRISDPDLRAAIASKLRS
jgi:hypothetical protein